MVAKMVNHDAMNADLIRAVMINEVVPADPADDFYGERLPLPAYLTTVLPLFQQAGAAVASAEDIRKLGVYLTNAVKTPKTASAVPLEVIRRDLPLLREELARFPDLKVVMLMGDVAKKAFNLIARADIGRNVIPAESTYKIRHQAFYWRDIRVMPSYIMTGANILIEKSKFQMAAEDIAVMLKLIA